MNRYTRHPRLMQRFLTACRSSPEFMTVAELAARSNTSSKSVARYIRILEAQGYLFRTHMNANGITQYRLIVEPREARPLPLCRIDTRRVVRY
jgi:hypothetical protein